MMETVLLFVTFLLVPFKASVIITILFLAYRLYFSSQTKGLNPFEKDERVKRRPYITDHKQRDAVLKQGFSIAKVPERLDAVVIGSGIGGLSTAAILSKAGKKVLVLEQHDQAGGCCHTFVDKGYEFDVGIHYVGKMHEGSPDKMLCDQITEGQLEWAPLDDDYDMLVIGSGDEKRTYPIPKGRDMFRARLEKQFPEEEAAIAEYFRLLDGYGSFGTATGLLKLLPRRLTWVLVKSGIIHLLTNIWRGQYRKSTAEVVQGLTTNTDLQTLFCYCYGDYGTSPQRSQFMTQVSLTNYFMKSGGYYPVGGASEIAFNIIPVIERSGGKVLVRAEVEGIIMENGRATGVRVAGGHEIRASMVISNAGVYNTFQRLLPAATADASYYKKIARELKPSSAGLSVFLGLNASQEELGLGKQNTWAFSSCDAALSPEKYFDLSAEEAMTADPPLAFFAFPSAKDPKWGSHPGRAGKSTCTIVSFSNWEWFRRFENTGLKKRGDEYDELKNAIGHRLIEQVCRMHPQIRNHIDYIEIGSPVTNKYYLTQPNGEIYGLDHTLERFNPWMTAQLRPETDVSGLFLTGQDTLMCGYAGALYGGLLCASSILNRNVMGDLLALKKATKKDKKLD